MDPNVLMNPAIMQAQLNARAAELKAVEAKTHFEMLANAQQLGALTAYAQPPSSPGMVAPPPLPEKGFPWMIVLAIAMAAALGGAAVASKDARDHQGHTASSR